MYSTKIIHNLIVVHLQEFRAHEIMIGNSVASPWF